MFKQFCLPLLCLALLAGCSPAAASSGGGSPEAVPGGPTPSPSAEAALSAPLEPDPGRLFYTTGSNGAQTEAGVYDFSINDDWTRVLCYTDFATKQRVVLCSSPNCTHSDESCPAWFGETTNTPGILTNGSVLIFCYGGMDGSEDARARVEVADLDGQNRRLLDTFQPNETLSEGYVTSGSAVYLLQKATAMENEQPVTRQTFWKIDLETGARQAVWAPEPNERQWFFLVGALPEGLVAKRISGGAVTEGDERSAFNSQTHTLYLLPADGSGPREIASWQQGQKASFAYGTDIFLIEDQTLYALDAGGGMTPLLKSDIFDPASASLQFADGQRLWLYSTARRGADEAMPSHLYEVALASGEISDITEKWRQIINIYGERDGQLVVEFLGDGQMCNIQNAGHAIISRDALRDGRTEDALFLPQR